jgi:hypothetical protein
MSRYSKKILRILCIFPLKLSRGSTEQTRGSSLARIAMEPIKMVRQGPGKYKSGVFSGVSILQPILTTLDHGNYY